jgi:hypothetical protein
MKVVVALCLLVSLAGCAAGNKAVYTPAKLALDYAGQGAVAVGVKDSRSEVVGGDRKETFVGLQRSLYGIPFAVQTESGKPFARDLGEMIGRGLKQKGVQAQIVPLSPYKSREEAVKELTATKNPRLLLFELKEWYGDTYMSTTLHYDLSLTVLDSEGRELGKSSSAGEDEVGRKQRPERKTIQDATADIIQHLLSAREVMAGLSSEARPKDSEKRCTVEQILKMRESGLAEEQIKAACGEA